MFVKEVEIDAALKRCMVTLILATRFIKASISSFLFMSLFHWKLLVLCLFLGFFIERCLSLQLLFKLLLFFSRLRFRLLIRECLRLIHQAIFEAIFISKAPCHFFIWKRLPFALNNIVARVHIMMVNCVSKRSHHGAREAPAETARHNAAKSPGVLIAHLSFARLIRDPWNDFVIFILVEHLVDLLPLLICIDAIPSNSLNKHSILEKIELIITPQERQVSEIDYVQIGLPKAIFALASFVPDEDYHANVLCIVVSLE